MRKSVWIAFDLGVKGDYQSLYQWLDENGAVECGDGLAYLRHEIANPEPDFANHVLADLKKNVTLKRTDRVYLIWKEGEKIKGAFLHGNRKAAPWAGFAGKPSESDGE